jgi:hypothetical protein
VEASRKEESQGEKGGEKRINSQKQRRKGRRDWKNKE